MHSTIIFATFAALAATTLAAPAANAWGPSHGPSHWWGGNGGPQGGNRFCLSDEQAQQAADVYRGLIEDFTAELAEATLTEDFHDYSSSVNIIINGGAAEPVDLLSATFDNRADFIEAQATQPAYPYEALNVFHGCDSVTVRWWTSRSALGQAMESDDVPVVGNVILIAVPANDDGAKYDFRLETFYSEFNSAAWLVNLGVFEPEESTSNTTAAAKRSIQAGYRGRAI